MKAPKKPDFEILEFEGRTYHRHRKDRGVLRGALDFPAEKDRIERTVPGFPQILRVYRLREGVERLFGNEVFFAEEKLDGYNARVFQHQGHLLAATRGGFICPFTTEWASIWGKDKNLDSFFRDFPEHVLCGEVIGDNPYNWQRDPNMSPGAHFFIFEIMAPDGNFLPPDQRYRLTADYGLPGVPKMGQYSAARIENLYELMRELNDRGREGVVLKDAAGKRMLKFVTPTTDLQDLKDALRIGFDLPSGFFFNRYLRASVFIKELGLNQEEYARRIGCAFLDGCPEPENFTQAGEQYTIYVQSEKTWNALEEQLKPRVLIACDGKKEVRILGRKMLRIDFRRIYQKSTQRYRKILRGHLHKD
ncbi:MAG: RNA ligase [Desulfobacterales bacterium]